MTPDLTKKSPVLYTEEEVERLRMKWPCRCCGGSAPHYAANHAKNCSLRAAVARIEVFEEGKEPT